MSPETEIVSSVIWSALRHCPKITSAQFQSPTHDKIDFQYLRTHAKNSLLILEIITSHSKPTRCTSSQQVESVDVHMPPPPAETGTIPLQQKRHFDGGVGRLVDLRWKLCGDFLSTTNQSTATLRRSVTQVSYNPKQPLHKRKSTYRPLPTMSELPTTFDSASLLLSLLILPPLD